MRKVEFALLSAYLGLQGADAILTQFSVQRGLARELNPIMAPFAGKPLFVVLKLGAAFISLPLLWWLARTKYPLVRRFANVALVGLVVLYSGVVAYTSRGLAKEWL